MSDFAKAQLLKYGWTEGKGLGKNENGIAEPLKPKLKFDTSGVGHKDNDFHWWDSVYDKALKNIVLEKSDDIVSLNIAKENAFNISSSKVGIESSKKKKHDLRYGNFLKTSTLQNGNMIKDETCVVLEEDNVDKNPIEIKITDEELFKACGGRTAHKGARHGLTLCGKLARIEEQERQLLAAGYLKSNKEPENKETKKRKRTKRKRDMEVQDCTTNVNNNDYYSDDDDCLNVPPLQKDYKPSKKSRLKAARKVNNLVDQLNKSCSINSNSINIEAITTDQVPCVQNGEINVAEIDNQNLKKKIKEKKKKSKRKRDQEVIVIDNDIVAPFKKKKKIGIVQEVEGNLQDFKIMYDFVNTDINRINDKIMRKKQRKYEKKEKKKLEELSKSLLAVNLDTIATKETIETTSKPSKRKEKKHKKKKNHNKQKDACSNNLLNEN